MSNEHAHPDESLAGIDEPPSHALTVSDSQDPVPYAVAGAFDVVEAKRALEAVLMSAAEPIPLSELKKVFDGEVAPDTIKNLLDELRAECADRSVELAVVASGYRYRVRPQFQRYLDKLSSEKPPKYSRAVLETLAIIAYRQPVTRGDIEDIRGVAVSPHILKTLQDRGWIDEIGHKETVGRPALFATTKHFLDDLNLRSLEELPPLGELATTLDMTQAGAALIAGETPSLPGVAESEPDSAADESGDAMSAADDAPGTHADEGEVASAPDRAGEGELP